MNIENLKYVQGLIRIPLENGQSLKVTPQECWKLIEDARFFMYRNYINFDPPLVKVVKINKSNFSVLITHNIDFWKSVDNGSWEPNTFRIFDDFLSSDCCFLDIGAWIGPTTLYAAQLAKRTYAFEPDPIAYRELEANVRANTNAEWVSRLAIYNKAIASSGGTIKLGSRSGGGDSSSSILFSNENTNWEIEAITLEEVVEAEKLQNEKLFIKMDIEGFEYELIPKVKKLFSQHRVNLFLSIHPCFLMELLLQGKQNSVLTKVRRRLFAVWHQIKIVRSLPFRYLYHSNGQRINLSIEVLKALLGGGSHFLTEIVATDKKWNRA